MAWIETIRGDLVARHAEADVEDARRVLELVEETRARLAPLFPESAGDVAVVLHGSDAQLCLAQPWLPLARRRTDPAFRRYLVGWFARGEIHLLTPRRALARASRAPGSRELLELAPAALYVALALGANNPQLPPPMTPRSFARYLRWAWLAQGAAQYFSGQTAHVRTAIARRLHDGEAPRLPPATRDAALLGGTVFDLLAREEGLPAAAALACRLHPQGAEAALREAFHGRALAHTAGTWRAHLARLAGATDPLRPAGQR